MSDEQFDTIYPAWVDGLSTMFWTPVEVAERAVQLMECRKGHRVLDVGSGCGKFCTVGALSSDAEFFGIEQRPDLVEVARTIAREHKLSQTQYSIGDMSDLDWNEFDRIYLYNPFHEQTSGPWVQIDDTISYSRDRQTTYVQSVIEKLSSLAAGTRVATYFGFGGTFPTGYTKQAYEHFEQGPLEVWRKD